MPLTTVNPALLDTQAQYTGFKSRIINGAMVIDQRNAGASVTPTDGQYVLDRWKQLQSVASKYSVQRNAGSVTPPAGFINYLGVTSLSAYSVASGDYFAIIQEIEGFNSADLAWGTASAATVTLSFWVRSSLTGTFGGAIGNSTNTRNYPFTYTISAANTWELETITIPGDTTGTWATDNTSGVRVKLGLGVGSTLSGTAGSWQAANLVSATGAVSVVGTNGATFYITGVQLEKGSTATSFDYRPYAIEEQLCLPYYEKSYDRNTVPGTATTTGGVTVVRTDGTGGLSIPFVVPKRGTPTVTVYATSDGTAGQVRDTAAGANRTASVTSIGQRNATVSAGAAAVGAALSFHYVAAAEL
jgi:hypothetical protein